VKDYLESHFEMPIRARDLARRHGCSTSTLVRRFQTLTGRTPHSYQAHLRAERATKLIRETSLDLDEVARRIGYASKKDLYRLLRVTKRSSPASLRESRR
jgi:transcriptional regulator GlxA family with amidase domain